MRQPTRTKRLFASIVREARWLGDRITGTGIARRLYRLERQVAGARTTYIGNGRLLTGMRAAGRDLMFYLDADDRLLTPYIVTAGVYDTYLTDYLAEALAPDSRCIDAGTNFGYFTCLLGALCPQGQVIGIEVEERSVALAWDNVLLNNLASTTRIVRAAASNSTEPLTLYRRAGRSGNTSISHYDEDFTNLMREPPVEPFTVGGVRVDDLVAEMGGRLDFMKVDVEGAEPLVIEGARAAIAANPQVQIAMEWSPGQIQHAGFDVPQFVADMTGLGLRPYDVVASGLAPLTSDSLLTLPYRAAILLKREG